MLHGGHRDVAIRAPTAAIPGEDHGPFLEFFGKGDLFSGGVFEGEVGGLVSDLFGACDDSLFFHGGDALGILGLHLGGRLRLFVFAFDELFAERLLGIHGCCGEKGGEGCGYEGLVFHVR